MPDLSPEQQVINRLRATQQVVRLHKASFAEGRNPLEEELEETLAQLDTSNLERLAVKSSLIGGGEVDGQVDRLNQWAREETRLGIGQRALRIFIAGQNQAISELLEGRKVTISRIEGASPRSLATHPIDGFQPVDGPVSSNFVTPIAQHGGLELGIVPTPAEGLTSHSQWLAHIINEAGDPQLGILIG